ncbi:multidrug effflux MFS transporter [Alkalilacustris brevis]|uniref:multidrug effflux MFS transporter n=1 Tax=Alkalilacustris brevis TaxID=2026338 RepID=UPI000E0D3D37|nr:multidrug effflux MFS transporter [Alkalilacustris brevis]
MLAMLFATVAFSIDAMLPSLSAIAADLSPQAVNRAQLVVTIFMLGMGVGTLVAGPLSDSFGRKRVVVIGMGIYCLAALIAAQAQSLELLLAARLVQGLGAAGPRVVTLAMVRDLYVGRRMAQVMSFVMTVFILVPVIAPTLGAWIAGFWGWRAVFLSFVVFGVVAGSWLMLRQPETLPPETRRPLHLGPVLAALREVFSSRMVVICIGALSLGFGQMFIFLSTSPQIFTDIFDKGHSFHYWFALVALAAGTSGLVNASLVMRLGMRLLASTAFATQAVLSALALLAFALAPLSPQAEFALFFAYMAGAFFMIGLTFGNLNALALEPMGHIAGMASAVVGAVSTILAVLLAAPAALLYNGTVFPLITSVMLCSGLAFVLLRRLRPGGPDAPDRPD